MTAEHFERNFDKKMLEFYNKALAYTSRVYKAAERKKNVISFILNIV